MRKTRLLPLFKACGFCSQEQTSSCNILNYKKQAFWLRDSPVACRFPFWHRTIFTKADITDGCSSVEQDLVQRNCHGYGVCKEEKHPELLVTGRHSATEGSGLQFESPFVDQDGLASDLEQVNFESLFGVQQSEFLTPAHREFLLQMLQDFSTSDWVLQQGLEMNISSTFFGVALSYFQKFALHACTPKLTKYLMKLSTSSPHMVNKFLFSIFREFCNREFPVEIAKSQQTGTQFAHLTKPHMWFPSARKMKRMFIYHSGPTNSGKTYNALKSFIEASSGVYCGPLRLLAMEVHDNVNAQGVPCSLLTGQEKRDVPSAHHLSCTIEMASTQQEWEVAVIDEAQLLTDEYRGFAWTRALLGLQASEIHLCGDPSALDLVRDICLSTGDELEEKVYERFTSLSIDYQSLGGEFQNVQPGDCIVAFSRKDVFTIKRAIERATSNRCCVVYGALPPETRAQQAKLFNDPNTGYDVLVATDAVGMGLNLNIRRVVFYSLDKFNGNHVTAVSASQVKQIAGRAGRRGSLFPEGVVTTFRSSDLFYLAKCLKEPFGKALSAGLFPLHEHLERFSAQYPNLTFSELLSQFGETCRVDGLYFLCRYDNYQKVAYLIDKLEGLTLEDRLHFCFAPINTRDAELMEALLSFAQAFSHKLPVRLVLGVPTKSARNDRQLLELESKHQVASLYLWLSQHFPEEYFPDKDEAEHIAKSIAVLLVESLARHIDFEDTFSIMLASVLEALRATNDRNTSVSR